MKDILVVEDGKKERERLEALFTGAGYSVLSCESVAEAEECLNREGFRLAVLDIGLSDKSGSHLFNTIQQGGKVSYIVIFTGNPSVHLKQRFMDEGAVDYIIKGSPQANNEQLLSRVKEIIGAAATTKIEGIELEYFLDRYVEDTSKQLYLDMDDSFPACRKCNSKEYVVTFSHKPQVPPEVNGLVVCSSCGDPMDPEVE
ncbi:MAG: response regulator [Bdellovibrionales bacterium]|nr:response regulator [Bdellovibrionales bacterium]